MPLCGGRAISVLQAQASRGANIPDAPWRRGAASCTIHWPAPLFLSAWLDSQGIIACGSLRMADKIQDAQSRLLVLSSYGLMAWHQLLGFWQLPPFWATSLVIAWSSGNAEGFNSPAQKQGHDPWVLNSLTFRHSALLHPFLGPHHSPAEQYRSRLPGTAIGCWHKPKEFFASRSRLSWSLPSCRCIETPKCSLLDRDFAAVLPWASDSRRWSSAHAGQLLLWRPSRYIVPPRKRRMDGFARVEASRTPEDAFFTSKEGKNKKRQQHCSYLAKEGAKRSQEKVQPLNIHKRVLPSEMMENTQVQTELLFRDAACCYADGKQQQNPSLQKRPQRHVCISRLRC